MEILKIFVTMYLMFCATILFKTSITSKQKLNKVIDLCTALFICGAVYFMWE